jgi:AraC family transcriptional regulator, positive regulator of tynA and feaB
MLGGKLGGEQDRMLRIYDTSCQAAPFQFDYWREELCHNFVELAPERFDRGIKFDGKIFQQSLSSISISRVMADAHCVNRTKHDISRSSEECFFANLQIAGRGLTRQGGCEVVSKPGDLVLVNTCQPYDITHDEPFDLISVKVPHTLLANRLELKRAPKVPHIAAEKGYGVVLRSYTMAILNDLDTEFMDSAPFLAENLVSLILSALSAANSNAASARLGYQQYARLQAILGFIKLNIADPALNLGTVAQQFALSPRYVQKLFAATGMTFSRTVLSLRLECIASELTSRERLSCTISELAFAMGFNDFTYFSRAFKQQFGVTARDYRARHAARTTSEVKSSGSLG